MMVMKSSIWFTNKAQVLVCFFITPDFHSFMGEGRDFMFPIRNGLKQGDTLSPLLFSFALECEIKWYTSPSTCL